MRKVILLVEDDSDDVELMQLAFKKGRISHKLDVAADGGAAITYLESEAKHPPCLILLDQNMPRVRGVEVLAWVRKNPATSHIPVLMLSSSRLKEEVHEAYRLGANGYFIKPAGLDALVEMVQVIDSYWFKHAVHPMLLDANP